MKKTIFIALLILLGALIIYLDTTNAVSWQPLAMILAAIAAPFRYIWNTLTDNPLKIQERHKRLREKEWLYQDTLEKQIQQRSARIRELDESIDKLERELNALDRKRSEIEAVVKDMNADEIRRAVWKYAGR